MALAKKRPNPADPLAKSYTCDRCPGKGAATGENVDAARPGCFSAPTAPRGDGRVPEDGKRGRLPGLDGWR